MRGGFFLCVTYVRENRAYLISRKVEVPWTNKALAIKWERFTSKLEPAAKETWTAVITGPDAKKAVTEMVATLYDASLDTYQSHLLSEGMFVSISSPSAYGYTYQAYMGNWPKTFSYLFRKDSLNFKSHFANSSLSSRRFHGGWESKYEGIYWAHRCWPYLVAESMARPMRIMRRIAGGTDDFSLMDSAESDGEFDAFESKNVSNSRPVMRNSAMPETHTDNVELPKISTRKNLNETAFFFPKLVSNKEGIVRMEFTMPEALTKWKFLGFAHDKEMRSGFLSGNMVTAKDIMVQPNPPRFLREEIK